MNKTRLEAFSDGVIAIIITIMVLELKAPHGTDWESIKPLLPVLLSYVMSFLFVGVYWGNHHHLLHVAKQFTSGIMLANLNLLFWLSLVPFATGWVGETHFATISVAVYAVLLNICGISYAVLQKVIESCHKDSHDLQMLLKHQNKKVIISITLYSSAVPLAWLHPYISVAIFFTVAIMWLVPDKNIEKAFSKKD
jgi:uncharacterized membrane protein